jgi:hypothetical protein
MGSTVQVGKQRLNAHNKRGDTWIRIFLKHQGKAIDKIFFNSLSEKTSVVVRLMQKRIEKNEECAMNSKVGLGWVALFQPNVYSTKCVGLRKDATVSTRLIL